MSEVDELSCKELVELVTEYLEGTLSPHLRAAFDEHLAICEGCRAYLEQMQLTIHVVGTLTEESIPPPAKAELLHAFRGWKKQRGIEQSST
jgi:predicted anti-sigma-YlaC factor YlaD